MSVDQAVTWGPATECYGRAKGALVELRDLVAERTERDKVLKELELEREDVKLKARENVDEQYENLPLAERKKVQKPTDHDRYLAAEEADKSGEYPKRIVELNRELRTLGLNIETLSYDINIETNYLRYLTAVEGSLHVNDPDVLAGGARPEVVSDPGREETPK